MLNALEASEEATRERFDRTQARAIRDQGFGASVEGMALTRAFHEKVGEVIQSRLEEVIQVHKRTEALWHLKSFSYVARNLDPTILALVALSHTLHAIANSAGLRECATMIGYAVQGEAWAAGLLKANAKLYARIERTVRKKHGSVKYRKQAARVIAAKAGYKVPNWTRPQVAQAGSFLLDCVVRALPHLFCIVEDGEGQKFPAITKEAEALAAKAVEEAISNNPVFLPCTSKPLPWTGFRRGGYWDERTRLGTSLVRTPHKEMQASCTAAMRNGSMAAHVEAVNALQDVAWRINGPVLEVVKWAQANGVVVKGVPAPENIPEPARLSDEAWADESQRKLQRYKIAQIKEHNRGLCSDRLLFVQDMATAERLVGEPAFYTPMNSDWRGRVYAVPHFNFQRDDRIRALFMFADGMPIGEEGLYWLKVHVANSGDFGKISKRPFEERVQWCDDRVNVIRMIAERPLDKQSRDWWTKADKPFLFVAACIELASAMSVGSSYVTRLPVSFDGSCSGLQHLCAMTRAAEGSLVNLTPSPLPQDVYQTVADLVRTRIVTEAQRLDTATTTAALATICLEAGIDRTLVKRNVMTFAYSSKAFGMAEQHREDTMKPLELAVLSGKLKGHPYAHADDTTERPDGTSYTIVGRTAAKYLAGHIYRAIEETVEKPALAMGFLQKLARALAHEGKPLNWATPTGLPWSNRYYVPQMHRVGLFLADTTVSVRMVVGDTKEIDKERSSNGVAPNFVHALDAAHLLLTARACVAEGIRSVATVHDSFGCLAPQAQRFREIIRETFVRMYEEHDVLGEVLESAKRDLTDHNWERLPDVPARGPLNLTEVLNAEFAFA